MIILVGFMPELNIINSNYWMQHWRDIQKQQLTQSNLTCEKSTGRGLEESTEYPTDRTHSFEADMQKNFSRTSSDLMLQFSKLNLVSCQDLRRQNSDYNTPLQPVLDDPQEDSPPSRNSLCHRKKKSIIVLDLQNCNDQLLMNRITLEKEPADFFEMTMLQQIIWQRLVSLPQSQINQACQIDVLINAPHEEHEMRVDIQHIPYNWDVMQLASFINQLHQKQKGFQAIQKPQLSMLVGRIKTQRFESSMKVFELINLIVNGVKLLILEEQGR